MRYFVKLAYKGINYHGWQKQPNSSSVQETIEKAFSTILNTHTDVLGCGRTDSGVHAKEYYLHFDSERECPKDFLHRLNIFLPKDIVIFDVFQVAKDAHARFDAYERSYEYYIGFKKDPFSTETVWYNPLALRLDLEKVQEAASLLLAYDQFFPFCKTRTDVKTMECQLKRSEWVLSERSERLVFHITANRFLRGMVRLIVGMCLNVGLGKTSIEEVKEALGNQTRLKTSLSVPPQGLYLTGIKYPFLD
ncbi:MAG: tRNA pseudouridine(38-40) synthase TruA [Bacteroidetes bacterium]|nr:tRNA pseudouridine(38-40) synthase TruA [Bacteroidota bacterium]